MAIEITTAKFEHLEAISRIAYEGFRDVAVSHGFPPDFPDVDSAVPVFDLLLRRKDYYGVVVLVDGKPVGSNFMMKSDEVGAIGPLTVDPAFQGIGIGRMLMTTIMTHATQRRFTQLRLLQDTYNVAALSLYCSLGFEVRDAVALIHSAPGAGADTTIRPSVSKDLPVMDRLSRHLYRVSRHNEIEIESQYGYPTYVRNKQGRISGYLMPGLAGHGVAETEEDAIALLEEAARIVPPVFRKFLCPMRQSKLFQESIKRGWRVEKLLTYMTYGPYEYPIGVCTPSACY